LTAAFPVRLPPLPQVNIFKRIFSGAERFTTLPWSAKLTDVPGLMTLGGQAAVDITVLIGVYLPTFYIFKVRRQRETE
jgi:hypothetical protein